MHITILHARLFNHGDCDWSPLSSFGDLDVYDEAPQGNLEALTQTTDVLVSSSSTLKNVDFSKLGPNLKLICLLSTGYDGIKFEQLNERGITVCNVSSYATSDVAQHAIALLLELARKISLHSKRVLEGEWCKENWSYWHQAPIDLTGKTLGIIGFGYIGRKVGEIAHALGMSVLAYSPTAKMPPDYTPFSFVSKSKIFECSDVISLHCPLTSDTKDVIRASSIAKMKDGVLIINTSRGGLVNSEDCAEGLRSKKIAGFACDVLSQEPPAPNHPLLRAPNVVITPHMAWASIRSRQRLIDTTGENIRRWIKGTPINVVNKPSGKN